MQLTTGKAVTGKKEKPNKTELARREREKTGSNRDRRRAGDNRSGNIR
jgi:hypothetical protein